MRKVFKKGDKVMVELRDEWIYTTIINSFMRNSKRFYTVKVRNRILEFPTKMVRKQK